MNPTFGPTREVLVRLGAKRADLIVEQGQFYRLISSWWLHGGILHWVVNMLALINLGFSLEKEFGTPKIMIIFCSCGFMGALCSAVFLPNVVGVGASGAIFGLFGSCFADLIQNWGLYKSRGNARTTLCQLVFGAVLNFLLGLIPMLDQFAHLAGFCTGVSRKLSLQNRARMLLTIENQWDLYYCYRRGTRDLEKKSSSRGAKECYKCVAW